MLLLEPLGMNCNGMRLLHIKFATWTRIFIMSVWQVCVSSFCLWQAWSVLYNRAACRLWWFC